MADQEVRRRANIGSSSLIVIFIVLCLVTFGVLSLGNAKSDSLLSDRNAEAVQEYYRADALGVDFLKQVDRALLNAPGSGDEAREAVLETLGDYYVEETGHFCTEIAMKADQALHIELLPDWDAKTVEVTNWYVYNKEDYEIDQSINVWDGT